MTTSPSWEWAQLEIFQMQLTFELSVESLKVLSMRIRSELCRKDGCDYCAEEELEKMRD